MDMDTKDVLEYLQMALRSVGAEVTSPWFYFQVGVVLAGAGIAFASGAAIRSRVDTMSETTHTHAAASEWRAATVNRVAASISIATAPSARQRSTRAGSGS